MKILPALLALALAAPALSAVETSFDLGDEVSSYKRFIIYPHLQKGFAALQRGDGKRAIAEFEAARKLAPDNATIVLYLSDTYQRYGQTDRAEAVLNDARQRRPNDARIADALATLQGLKVEVPAEVPAPDTPERVTTPETVEEAMAAGETKAVDCAQEQTPACRAMAGKAALRQGKLAQAQAELDDARFAASPQGIALRHALVQRAIYLRDWPRAEAQLSALKAAGELTASERSQWINLLLNQGKLSAAQALLEQGGAVRAQDQLAYAQALAHQGDKAALGHFLAGKRPAFLTVGDERQWMGLLQSSGSLDSFSGYSPRFAANRSEQAEILVPKLIEQGDDVAAQRLLDHLPAEQMLQERFVLSLKSGKLDQAGAQASALLRQKGKDATLIDTLSYQLIQAGGQRQALRVLLVGYPFDDAKPIRRAALFDRLTLLVNDDPSLLAAADKVRLQRPLDTVGQRSHQAALFAGLKDCKQVLALLGDLSPAYAADDWLHLGDCYRETAPGLAQYSYEEARLRQGGDAATRALAYQAFTTKDYPTALQAWQSLPTDELQPSELIAATNTALAAGDQAAAASWLDAYAGRGGSEDDQYWWLRAQAETDDTLARADLERAIAIRQDARYYLRLASLQSADKQYKEAIASLQQAEALDPDNPEHYATLGYAYWFAGDTVKSREALEKAHKAYPDDTGVTQQLVYSSQRMVDNQSARAYAREVIDDLDRYDPQDKTDEILDQWFGFRRLHEDLGRRWTFSAGAFSGTNTGSVGNSPEPGTAFRSYSQVEAEYRLGDPAIRDGKTLAAYARIFAGSAGQGNTYDALPIYSPMLGVGLRWKPLRDWAFFLAAEAQTPLDHGGAGETDYMLRASASLLNDGRFSDDWHESGRGWVAQNLYLDAAYYIKSERVAATADYRLSYHNKVFRAQTVEPYAHVQYNLIQDDGASRDFRGGIGVRWNFWYGESRYNAYPHKISVGVEFQHAFDTYLDDNNTAFLTFGGIW
ncbi:phage receptor [Jeongeupia sp. HS-3]|uniref:NfrA family protein n=1 Tax=Jeongeupia sp. HS-3 TaxID=1009682 RepID=UPI0018A4C3AF|nr:tetratricopeptide repeat protein [Jeongeupia sp. HS-3]BCL75561.1 phage receptor [Jeongeupia sp. HS-3]